MVTSTSPSEVTQALIDALLSRLKELRDQIAQAHQDIKPLQNNLKKAYEEFQVVVGEARRQYMRLQAEIANLQAQLKDWHGEANEEALYPNQDDRAFYQSDLKNVQAVKDPEEIAKDVLYEHLMKVLDPIDDADLFTDLQRLCQDPIISLPEVLERAPWKTVWCARAHHESLTEQYGRLKGWEQSLTRRLENLNRVEERLKKDHRYGLLQQRQKGEEEWRNFLDQALIQQQHQNYDLEAKLEKLRQEWEQKK